MLQMLSGLKGNPKYCVYTEALWGIPYNLYAPFIAVYMSALLLTDSQIGIVASITMFSRAVFAILSGALTDKLGRRMSTFICDILSWSVPCILWTFAQNFWWFVIAAAFCGILQISDIAWNCLLVEDAEKSQMVAIYSWIHITGQLAVFFAPLSAIIVDELTIIPAMRILYAFAFVSMTAKFIILFKYCTETEIGEKRMKETAGVSIAAIMSGYGEVAKKVLHSREMMISLTLSLLFNITLMVRQNFFGLYTTQNLMIQQSWLAYFPIIRSIIVLLFLFFIQNKLERFGYKGPMLIGVLLYVASHLFLIFGAGVPLVSAVVYTIMEACAHALVMPRTDSIKALFIDENERARINSVMNMVVFGVSIPFGYFTGYLSDANRIYPFVFGIIVFVCTFVIIAKSKSLSRKNMEQAV